MQKLRFDSNVSQEELEARCNMRHQYISRLETGRVIPKVNTIRKIVWALGYDFTQFAMLYEQYFRAMQNQNENETAMPMAALHDSIEYNCK